MKKLFLLPLMIFGFTIVMAQSSNVIIFSQDGDAFTAILNGERMNESPLTNLKITDLTMPNYKLRIIFNDAAKGAIDKTIYFEPGMEYSYQIKLTNKGEYAVRLFSQVELAQAPPPPATQTVTTWGTPAPAVTTTVVVQETVTTTSGGTTSGSGTTETFSMDVNMGGTGVSMNVNVNDGGMGTSATTTDVSHTTTTTTTTTTMADPVAATPVADCYQMSSTDYQSATSSISSKTFEDSKMTTAKQVAGNNCLSATQVKGIMELMTFEDGKLEFAKFAYDRCVDKQNYYQVNDAFDFESTIEDLDKYIQSKR